MHCRGLHVLLLNFTGGKQHYLSFTDDDLHIIYLSCMLGKEGKNHSVQLAC